jgi:hypothetical protein
MGSLLESRCVSARICAHSGSYCASFLRAAGADASSQALQWFLVCTWQAQLGFVLLQAGPVRLLWLPAIALRQRRVRPQRRLAVVYGRLWGPTIQALRGQEAASVGRAGRAGPQAGGGPALSVPVCRELPPLRLCVQLMAELAVRGLRRAARNPAA